MTFNKNIHILQDKIFDAVLYITYILYIAIALGISANAPEYLDELQYYIKLYISLFLIYRFNPFRRVKFTGLDAKIAFYGGLFFFSQTNVYWVFITFLVYFKVYLNFFKFNT